MLTRIAFVLNAIICLCVSTAQADGHDGRVAEVAAKLRLDMLRPGPPRGAPLALSEADLDDIAGASGADIVRFLSVGTSSRPSFIVEWHIDAQPGALAEIAQLLPQDDASEALAQRIAGLPVPIDAVSRHPSLQADILVGIAPDDHISMILKGDILVTARSFGPIPAKPLAEGLMRALFPDR